MSTNRPDPGMPERAPGWWRRQVNVVGLAVLIAAAVLVTVAVLVEVF